jgi:dipeptidyl aminopeptidase/acylaminoacyl peptidase
VAFDPVAGVVRGERRGVTRSSRAYDQPAVSPDGLRLAFNSSSGKQEDIFVAAADGSGVHQVTNDQYKDRAARWSPTEDRIAFYSDRTGAYEIWTVRPDGSEPQQLTRSPGAHYPVWSPNGRSMAYSTHAPNGAFIFDVTRPWDQQKPQPLPAIADRTLTFEIWGWSPDGKFLAGQKHLADLSHAGIAIHEVGSDRIDWLTDFGEWPVWLSDSRRLLFSDHGKLFLLDSTTRKHREVLALPQRALGSVGLSRDDRHLYYTVMASEADVWLMSLK